MTTRECRAIGCHRILNDLLFCRGHWLALPRPLRKLLYSKDLRVFAEALAAAKFHIQKIEETQHGV